MLIDTIEIQDNDVYFLEAVNDKIVINDNYNGILIFDSTFNLLKKIYLINDLIIYFSYKNEEESEILLYCPENNCFIYINLLTYYHKIILLDKFDEWIFSPFYKWNKEEVILTNYRSGFAKLNFSKSKLFELDANSKECCLIREDCKKLVEFNIIKIFSSEKRALVENSQLNLSLIEYKEDIKTLAEFEKELFYDFEIINKYIVEIGENKIYILNEKNKEIWHPKTGYCFLRGKLMRDEKEIFLYLLSGNKSNSNEAIIEKYILQG